MTALIGGICVGVLWGFWATREIIKSKREIKARIERNKTRNAKLEAIITLHNMMMEGEIWKSIKDFENYKVSNMGRVMGPYGVIFAAQPDTKGYLRISLYKNRKGNTKKIHRLVAEAFVLNPDNLPQVNHKNYDKTDNRVENLEWCDNPYNGRYSHGRITMNDAREIRALSLPWTGFKQQRKILAEMYNISVLAVKEIRARKRWRE
jgi:hypothetical protein